MSSLAVHMMCTIIAAFVSVLVWFLTQRIRFLLSEQGKRRMSYALLVVFYICSMFLIDSLCNPFKTIWLSWLSILYAMLGLLLCGGIIFLIHRLKGKWKRIIPMQLLMDIQCFLQLYLIVWHVVLLLLSFGFLNFFETLKDSDLVLLLVMCEAGILSALFTICFPDLDHQQTYQGLTKDEYRIYRSSQKSIRHQKNKY